MTRRLVGFVLFVAVGSAVSFLVREGLRGFA